MSVASQEYGASTAGPVAAVVLAASDVMTVEDVTEGVPPGNSVRLRGRLLAPAEVAYERLAERLKPLGRTPMLRKAAQGAGDEMLAIPITFTPSRPKVIPAAIMLS
jgi:hypothetical protein